MKIRMFMWKWQHVFQISVDILVKNIFEILELQTVANTFILGIPTNNEAINQIFFQPEDCGILQDEFRDVWLEAKTNYENDPEQNLFMAASHINKAHKESLYPKALRTVIQDILSRSETVNDIVSFCSFPIKMNDHWVITVIQLDQNFFDQQYRLQSEKYKINSMRSSRIDRSFLEAIIYRVLSESQKELPSSSEGNRLELQTLRGFWKMLRQDCFRPFASASMKWVVIYFHFRMQFQQNATRVPGVEVG